LKNRDRPAEMVAIGHDPPVRKHSWPQYLNVSHISPLRIPRNNQFRRGKFARKYRQISRYL
jgi:hypothetical protein